MLSYDWDSSPANRSKQPMFYGYLPDKASDRAVCFLSMTAFTFAHSLMQTCSCSLLAAMNMNWLLYYLGLDMLLYFMYKIAKNDFFYFINKKGLVRFFIAILHRTVTKTLANFTLFLQIRHPHEVGGLAFLFSIPYTIAGSFISIYLYSTYDGGEVELDVGTLQILLGSLCTLWFISGVTFLAFIDKTLIHTFYNADNTSEFKRKFVLHHLNNTSNPDDGKKIASLALKDHPDVYSGWADELLKPWTLKNWGRWDEEQPSWFNETWVEGVPNEYVPFKWREKYMKTGRV
ncbi:hypothetical protein TrLO_g13415 [Triparma laevis f. longispina]|uniref:Uncharacterized protein n=1 Tax=Triparma laevis f. longispina TaxID=1714387 RepID=A0A9W7FQT0_9STRA|nr:hypothetical protein TrLO_g13415 [Triparma laevis f. longispina]